MKIPNPFGLFEVPLRGLMRTAALLLALVAVLFTMPVSASAVAGHVLLVKGNVISDAKGREETALSKGGEVYVEDTIYTGGNGFLVLKMIDDTKLTLRPDSEISLNTYSMESGQESAAVELIKGGLRAITGTIAKKSPESFELVTSTTTIGIRGTDFIARLCSSDRSSQCGNMCAFEEQVHSSNQRTASRPLSINGDTTASTMSECEPLKGISEGVYVALYDGKLNVESKGNELEIESVIAAQVVDDGPECLIDLPNFLAMDPYLSQSEDQAVRLLGLN